MQLEERDKAMAVGFLRSAIAYMALAGVALHADPALDAKAELLLIGAAALLKEVGDGAT